MSRWDFLNSNRLDQAVIQRLYANYELPFLVEVRETLKYWIEENLINANSHLDAQNPEHHAVIYHLLHNFIIEIDREIQRLQQDQRCHSLRNKLINAGSVMKTELALNVLSLYQTIRRILNLENGFVQQAIMVADQNMPDSGQIPEQNNSVDVAFAIIGSKCSKIKALTDNSILLLRSIREHHGKVTESFRSQRNLEAYLRQDGLKSEDIANAQRQLTLISTALENERYMLNCFVSKFMETTGSILQSSIDVENDIVQTEIVNMKKEPTCDPRLVDVLQSYCSDLSEALIRSRLQLIDLQSYFPTIQEVPNMLLQFSEYYAKLYKASLLIDKQPCQVIKKKTKFPTNVRFLAGTHNIPAQVVSVANVRMNILNKAAVEKLVRFDAKSKVLQCVNVVQNIVSTSTAARRRNQSQGLSSGSIQLVNENDQREVIGMAGVLLNNVEPLAKNDFSASFQKSIINDIFPCEKESGKSKLDLPYWILFHTELTETFNGKTQKTWIWTLSNALKVITHADQKAQAFETIIWLNAMDYETLFSENTIPDALPWENVAVALNRKCLEMTKVSLSKEQLNVLREKAFSIPLPMGQAPSELLTFEQFCKTRFLEYDFTFWKWFYEIMKLTLKHLCGAEGKGPWQDGLIDGFMSRETAANKLINNRKVGAFLLRFSDSKLGGISVVWLQNNDTPPLTCAIDPATNEDLLKRPLVERILDLNVLTHMYPDKPKDDVFSKYKQKPNSGTKSGAVPRSHYVRPYLQMILTTSMESKASNFGTTLTTLLEAKTEPSASPRPSIFGTPPSTPYFLHLQNSPSPSIDDRSPRKTSTDFQDLLQEVYPGLDSPPTLATLTNVFEQISMTYEEQMSIDNYSCDFLSSDDELMSSSDTIDDQTHL